MIQILLADSTEFYLKEKGLPDKEIVRDAWAKVTDTESEDVEVTKAVVALYSLSQEIQSLIKINEKLNHELYLASFKRLEQAFFPLNLGTNWQSPKQHLTEEALTRLQFCANELCRYYSEETLSEEELADIVAKTNELFEALISSSLPDALRLALLEEIERIRSAIHMYKIRGAKGLKEALQSTMGAVIANQEEIKSQSISNSDVIERLGVLIDKLDKFTTRALKLKRALANPIRFVLEKLTDDSDTTKSEDAES